MKYLCAKAYSKVWVLMRFKALKMKPLFLLDVQKKEIRSILELAVPPWHSGVTMKQSDNLERAQKVSVSIILGENLSYDLALAILELEPLQERRHQLCMKFAQRTLKSKHSDMFLPRQASYDTRYKQKFTENISNTQRCYNSPVNFLLRLLNA